MVSLFQPYTLLLIASVALPAALAVTVVRRRFTLGCRAFAVLMGATALWAFTAIFEVCAQDESIKLFSYSFKYLFVVLVPVAWFIFGLYYSHRVRQLRWVHLALLLVVPLITLALVATNGYHYLMFKSVEWYHTPVYFLLFRQFGPWFWIHTAYCYLLLFLGVFFLAKALLDSPGPFRSQLLLLVIGALAPWICNIIFIFKVKAFAYLDITPFAFAISGAAFMWGVLRYRLLDIVPIAHDIVIENMNDGMIVTDARSRILDLNPAAARLVGKGQRELIGVKAGEAISWWSQLAAGEAPLLIEVYAGNRRQWLRAVQSPLFGKGRVMGQLVLLHDITVVKQAEEALRWSEARFKSLGENAPVIIFTLDNSGCITYLNPAWEKSLGHCRQEVVGKPFADFVVCPEPCSYEQIFEGLIQGQASVAEMSLRFWHQDGSKRLFNVSVAVNSDAEGRITGIIGLAKDITVERKLQNQLFQSQKMEAIGTYPRKGDHIGVDLRAGQRATISLLPPTSPKVLTTRSAAEETLTMPPMGGRVLLVDDEALILECCREMIRSLGFTVMAAASGEEAVRLYRSQADRIDVVVLDIIMPGMDGCQTYAALKAINPQVKVIFVSGYVLDSRLEQILAADGHTSLRKPFTRDALARTIAKVIGPRIKTAVSTV